MCAFPGGFLFLVTHLMWPLGVSYKFKTPIKGCRVMDSFMLLVGFEFQWVCMARRCRYHAFPIAPRLNAMLTGAD